MVGAGFADDPVQRGRLVALLHELLQLGLVVAPHLLQTHRLHVRRKQAQRHRAGRLDARVEVDGAEDRFERVGEEGASRAAARGLFAAPEPEILSDPDLFGAPTERRFADEDAL